MYRLTCSYYFTIGACQRMGFGLGYLSLKSGFLRVLLGFQVAVLRFANSKAVSMPVILLQIYTIPGTVAKEVRVQYTYNNETSNQHQSILRWRGYASGSISYCIR